MANYLGNKIADRLASEYEDFQKMENLHTRPFQQFNSSFDGKIRSLTDYIDYSFAKFNQFVEIPEDSEDYEVHLKMPHIRNKLMAILARLSAQRMKSEVHAQNMLQGADKELARFIGMILEWSDDTSQQDKVHFDWMLETAMKGTGILCEDYYRLEREVKEILEYDPITGKSRWKKKKIAESGCRGYVVPLEEFFVWNIREPDIQRQSKVVWATVMPIRDFKRIYAKYPKAKEVIPGGERLHEDTFFQQYLHGLGQDMVSVRRIFNRDQDEFKIIANNVELTEEDNPIPFKHKNLPFVRAIYEPIQPDFFYGKSLADKGGNIADAIDQLFNDLFNRNQMSLKAPLVAKKGSVLQDSVWRPDSILWYTGEKPERLEVGTGSQDTDRLFNILSDQLNLSTVSPTIQGQAGSGSTAREVIMAQENANELMSMFQRMMEWAEGPRAEMRISNLLQFLEKGEIEDITEMPAGTVRILTQGNVELSTGKFGTREIRLMREGAMTPPNILERQFSETHEIIEVSMEALRRLKYYVRIVPNSSIKISQSLKKALDVEYATTMANLFPNLVNQRELATSLTEAFDKSPEKMLVKEEEGGGIDEQISQLLGGGALSPRMQRVTQGIGRQENALPSLVAV